MKKSYLLLSCAILITFTGCTTQKTSPQPSQPPIVDYFACGDNCPGPREQYEKKVYEGVTTKEECDKLNGVYGQFTGWTTQSYCEVKK